MEDFEDFFLVSESDDKEKTEFIPLITNEEEEIMNSEELPSALPLLPLKNTVLFPEVVIPITAGREKSIKLIKESYRGDKIIGTVAQKDADVEDPSIEDLYKVGTVAKILKLLQMPDGSTTAIIQGKRRFSINKVIQTKPYIKATVNPFDDIQKTLPKSKNFIAMVSSLKDIALQIIKQSPNIPSDTAFAINNIESPLFLINFTCANLDIPLHDKQRLLEITDINERASQVLTLLTKELQIIELKNQIQNKVKSDIDKQQRDYFLNQQLKTIQEELGGSPSEQEIKELEEKASKKKWPAKVAESFDKELVKLKRMNPQAAEYSVQMNYLEVLVELPWEEYTEDNFDLDNARKILDEDHYGLEKIKERIIEFLAVVKLKGDMKSPILCLVGPPGVGKTSLGKSIARSLGRNYVRMSLGGIRDEAEIRGHRKTYIGAMPGRIIQLLKKAKSSNPVFVLDEIDKVSGNNINGDPQAALLEILDPEQNVAFYDNYLEIDYDLSRVMFIATANNLSTIHPALRDRMEVIELSGYLLEEKTEIALQHLVPKQLKEHGMSPEQLTFNKSTINQIIENYTREAGVRTLERLIAKIIRNRAKYIVTDKKYNISVNNNDINEILGVPDFHGDKILKNKIPGIATGLAWTIYGGEILFIESSISRGKGNLTMTGNLGDVMKESATLAYEYLKAHSDKLNIEPEKFEKWNVHIHVPEGATPKDGPSAGITMFTSLASAFTGIPVNNNVAMTGEITLRGRVLPVGGIKDKILAAKRANIRNIILSVDNKKDVADIPKMYIEGLKFYYIEEMIEVIGLALQK